LAILFLAEDAEPRKISSAIIAAICVSGVAAAILLCAALVIWRYISRRNLRDTPTVHVVDKDAARLEHGKPPNGTAVTSIDLATLEKATRNFSPRNVIGQGAFGIVYEVTKTTEFHLLHLLNNDGYNVNTQ
jgi:hypothetical protein